MEQRTRLNFSVWCQKSCIPRVEVWGQSRVTRLRLELLQTNKLILCSLCHLTNTVKHSDSFLKNMLTTYKICIFSSHSTSIALISSRTPTLHIFINLFSFFFLLCHHLLCCDPSGFCSPCCPLITQLDLGHTGGRWSEGGREGGG